MIATSRMRRNLRTGNDVSVAVTFLNAKNESFRTKAYTRVFTAAFIGESCVNTICDRLGPELNVTRSAL